MAPKNIAKNILSAQILTRNAKIFQQGRKSYTLKKGADKITALDIKLSFSS